MNRSCYRQSRDAIVAGMMLVSVATVAQAAAPIGVVDAPSFDSRVCTGGVVGWACDGDDFNRPLIIEFSEGGAVIDRTVGDKMSIDGNVANLCGGTGGSKHYNHVYQWTLPESLRDSTPRTVSVSAIDPQDGTRTLLSGAVPINCPPSLVDDAQIGLWDPGIVNGKTQSEYGNYGCPGSPPIQLGECQFFRKGSAGPKPFGNPVTGFFSNDEYHDGGAGENCPTETNTCDGSAATSGYTNWGAAANPCPKGASTQFGSCNTYVSSGSMTSDSYWYIENNFEPTGFPWFALLPNSFNCAIAAPVGPPNKTLPIGSKDSGGPLEFWQNTSACGGKIVNMKVNFNYTHPCVQLGELPEMTAYYGWGTEKTRGNQGKPIAVFQYPADDWPREKTITFNYTASVSRTDADDIARGRVFLESYWNGKKRWIFLELARFGNPGGVVNGLAADQVFSIDWNWPVTQSRQYPGAVIAYNPFMGEASNPTPFVSVIQATTQPQARAISINVEDLFEAAIDRYMFDDPDYPTANRLDRNQLGRAADKPAPGTILYVNAVTFITEGGRVNPEGAPKPGGGVYHDTSFLVSVDSLQTSVTQ